MKKYFIVLFSLFIISSVFSESMPKWVTRPYKEYSRDEYLVGVGSGKKESDSELDAVNEIVSVFGQSIISSSNSSQYKSQVKSENLSEVVSVRDFSQKVQRLVNQEDLIGITIVEKWHDEKNDEFYTLAVLNKVETAGLYKAMIKNNEKKINNLLNSAKIAPYLDAFIYLGCAFDLAELNEENLSRLYVVDFHEAEKLEKTITNKESLLDKKNEIGKKCTISISLNQDLSNIYSAIVKVLTDRGLFVSETDSVYNIECILSFDETAIDGKPGVFYLYSANLKLKNNADSKVLFSAEFTGKEGGKTEQSAKSRTENVIIRRLQSELEKALESYIDVVSVD